MLEEQGEVRPDGSKVIDPLLRYSSRFAADTVTQCKRLEEQYQNELRLPARPQLVTEETTPLYRAPVRYSANYGSYRDSDFSFSAAELVKRFLRWASVRRVRDKLFLFQKSHYRPLEENETQSLMLSFIRDVLRQKLSFSLVCAAVALLKIEPTIAREPEDSPEWLTTQNGEVFLSNLQWNYSNPARFHTRCIMADWVGYQATPVFDAFLRTVSGGDPLLQQRLLEAIGYLLVSDYRAKRLVIFQGASNSGKSVLGNLIKSFFEPGTVSALPAHQFGRNFALEPLEHCHLNISADLADGVIDSNAVAILKQITGGDSVSIEGKGKPAHTGLIWAKILFATNHPVSLRTIDEAFAGRILLIPFRFPVPQERMDHHLLDKLMVERSGILFAAVSAFREVVRRNFIFTGEDLYGFKLRDIVIPESPQVGVEAFLQACCEVGNSEQFTTSETIYTAYLRYCAQTARNALGSSAAFSRTLNSLLLGQIQPIKRRVDGIPLNGYKGIRLKGESDETP